MMGFSISTLNWILLGMKLTFIIGNKFGGYLADMGGIKRCPHHFMMTCLLLMMAPLFHFPWLDVLAIALICVAIACYGASTPADVFRHRRKGLHSLWSWLRL